MSTYTCSRCNNSFYGVHSNCPHCGVPFDNYVPPQQMLSSYEISQLENAYSNMTYQQQQAVSSSSNSFWNWVERVARSIWNKAVRAFTAEGVRRFASALWDIILGG